MERWERRERKKEAERNRLQKSGVSVKLIQKLIGERAARAKAQLEETSPAKPAVRRHKPRRRQ
jgi:hypothetical protein